MYASRPLETDSSIVDEAVALVLSSVLRWSRWQRSQVDQDLVRSLLTSSLREHHSGYETAKYLESTMGIRSIDAKLVTILECGHEARRFARDKAVRAWVNAIHLRPRRKIGDVVKHGYRTGKIIRIRSEEGIYEFISEASDAQVGMELTEAIPFEEVDIPVV